MAKGDIKPKYAYKMETTPQAINEMCQTVCSLHEIYHVLIYLVHAVISEQRGVVTGINI